MTKRPHLLLPRRGRRDPSARLRAVLALPDEGVALPALLDAAADPSPEEMGDLQAAELARAALGSSSSATRMVAAITLGILRAPGDAVDLRVALGDPVAAVRRCAVEAIAERGPDAVTEATVAERLHDEDAAVRAAAVGALTRVAAIPAARLAPALVDASPLVRVALARVAARLDEEMVTALLADPADDVRAAALWALAERPRPQMAPSPAPLLADASPHVRRAAARAAGTARDPRARDALIAALLDDASLVRAEAQRALDEIFAGGAPRILAERLSASDPRLRAALVYALGRYTDPETTRRVAALAEDRAPDVRLAVAQILVGRAGDRAEGSLRRLATDPDPAVARAARISLGQAE